MRLARRAAFLSEPFVCPSCVAQGFNARPRLRNDRKLHQAVFSPSQRKVSQLHYHEVSQFRKIGPRVALRSLATRSHRNTGDSPHQSTPLVKLRKPTTPATANAHSSTLLQMTQDVVGEGEKIINSSTVPEETEVLEVLEKYHALSEYIIFGRVESPPPPGLSVESLNTTSATSSLLKLQENAITGTSEGTVTSSASSAPIEVRQKAAAEIHAAAYSLLLAPRVFISPPVLDLYTRISCLLGKPETLPEIFSLYANKPIPQPNTSNPVQFRPSNPKSPSNAIPKNLADAALSAAIATKNLPLALSIIDTTVKAPAWFRRKVIRESSPSILSSSALPFVAYLAATTLVNYQMTTTVTTATGLAFAGIMTYFVVTGTLGYVALTTFNDHHERVRWRNLPLTERWTREDERAMFDRIALGWGFKEKWRWGEEEGAEWEALREFCGRRGMILDRTELLEGME